MDRMMVRPLSAILKEQEDKHERFLLSRRVDFNFGQFV